MKLKQFLLGLLFSSLFMVIGSLSLSAQNQDDCIDELPNCILIGDEYAPIQYIRGTGTSIGLYVGVEFTCDTDGIRAGGPGVGHGRGPGVKGPGGQGGREEDEYNPIELEQRHEGASIEVMDFNHVKPIYLNANSSSRSDHDDFQILPFTTYEDVEANGIVEVLLPNLCLELYEPVPLPENQYRDSVDFNFPVTDAVAQSYVGIYRFDEYLKRHVIQHAWLSEDGSSIAYSNALTEAEITMLLFCKIDIVPGSLGNTHNGFYDIEHAHLLPSHANFVIWAAAENQDEGAFLRGINHISETCAADPECVQARKNLNHLVFSFAEMDSFTNRFSVPWTEDPPTLNLNPYPIIRYFPGKVQEQNNADGVQFEGHLSLDPDGDTFTYSWDFGDGATSMEQKPRHIYNVSGTYTVTLTLTDSEGNSSDDLSVKNTVTFYVEAPDSRIKDKLKIVGISIAQNSPNPFSDQTTFTYSISYSEEISLKIFNHLGQRIRSLIDNEKKIPGEHHFIWDGRNENGHKLPQGIYYYKFQTEKGSLINKMVLRD